MNRFVEACFLPDGSGGQHADGAGKDSCFVGKDVAKHVACHHHVKERGMDGKLLGAVIHIHVVQLDVRIFFVMHPDSCPSPQAGGCQHVGFVHACHMAAALSGCFHGKAGNSFHFRNGVAFYVPGPFHAVIDFRFAPFSEINAAHQFPDNHNVGASGNFGLQRRVFNHGILDFHRTKVHIEAQGFPKAQDGLFRPQ